jgi:cytochrome c biogenesis protein CcmG/thiol:disulfide interchange protein DsbE
MKSIISNTTSKPIELIQLDLVSRNGEKVNLQTGKPIVVNFWATWCVPCVKEFPEFEELNAKYADKVNFVMVSDEEMTKIENFKAKKHYKLNMLRSTKTFDKYGLTAKPATYFYNSEGKLINNFIGGITKEELEKEIIKLIGN